MLFEDFQGAATVRSQLESTDLGFGYFYQHTSRDPARL
jgi:hypothetical protein